MSWSRRSVLLGFALVAGCGFQPVYGPGGAGSALQGQVLVDAPETPLTFTFARQLELSLGRNSSAAYGLSYTLTTGSVALAITSDQEIQRFHVNGLVQYTVTNRSSGAVVSTGQVESFTGYSTTGNVVATTTAIRDAEQRLAVILADLLLTRLIATAGDFSS